MREKRKLVCRTHKPKFERGCLTCEIARLENKLNGVAEKLWATHPNNPKNRAWKESSKGA